MKRLEYESPKPPTPKGDRWLGGVIIALWGAGILAVLYVIACVIASSIDDAITMEAEAQAICMKTKDFHRAYEAFANKRNPEFQGD